MSKLKIGIIGSGKLAISAVSAIEASKEFQLAGIYSKRTDIECTHDLPALVGDSDVLIDCSISGFEQRLADIAKPIVIATTQEYDDRKLPNVPILILPNASIGWNMAHIMLEKLAKQGGYEFIISDIHHKHKKDAPSGTARRLIKALQDAGAQTSCSSYRIGDVCGIHDVIAIGEHEMIKIEHSASSRMAFGHGLLKAAFWLSKQKTGIYDARDWLSA